MPAARCSAPNSSQVPITAQTASTPIHACRTVSNATRTTAPIASPTPIAIGRSRPAREGLRSCAGSSSAAGSAEPAGSADRAGAGRRGRDAEEGMDSVTSDLEELGFLVLHEIVDLRHVAGGHAFELLLGPLLLVLADLPVLDDALQLVHRGAAHAADGDLGVLALAARDLDHVPAPLLGELREDDADDLAVVARVDPEVGVADRALHALQLAGVVGLDDGHTGLGDLHRGELVERGPGAVVLDLDAVEHGRAGPTGAHAAEVVLGDADRLLHLLLGVEERLVDHGGSPQGPEGVWTSVPILSPRTARAMFPSTSRLNTMIGMLLSMQRLKAVASATLSPFSSTSRWVISWNIAAVGSSLGSAV